MIYTLDSDAAWEILRDADSARLGCIVDDEPYVVPVHYVVSGECLYIQSLPGKKVDGMRENPRVCLQVDRIDSEYRWRSVQAFGAAREVLDAEEAELVFRLIHNRFPHLTPADAVRRYGRSIARPIPIRILVDRIAAVREGEAPAS